MSKFVTSTLLRTRLSQHLKTRSGALHQYVRSTPRVASLFPKTLIQTRDMSGEARQTLADILGREHAEEIENESTVMPDDLGALKKTLEKEHGWKIVDDGAMTKLYRTIDSSKVQVTFHCQDAVELEDEDFDEESIEAASPVRFTVTVTKAGKSLAMTCITTEDLSVSIQNIVNTSDQQAEVMLRENVIPSDVYQGPEFMELAEDLQDAFHNYLIEDVGIGSDFVSFVSMYCDFKEQTEYVNFLEDTKAILS